MARYGFVGPGMGMGGGRFGVGLGASLNNALTQGIELENMFRDLENRGITDQFRVPAQAAGYDAARLDNANQAVEGAAMAAQLSQLVGQQPVQQAQAFPQSQGQPPGLSQMIQQPAQPTPQPQQSPATNRRQLFDTTGNYPLGPYYMSQ